MNHIEIVVTFPDWYQQNLTIYINIGYHLKRSTVISWMHADLLTPRRSQ